VQRPKLLLEGKYEILAKIREGGMGTIYKVRHRLLDEIRVVKVMQPHVVADADLKRRFLEEAKTAIRLKHPNICTIFDFAVDEDGTAYLVMEYIDGVNLADLLRSRGRLGVPLTIEIAHQALLALGYLHRKSVIHRDVAPDNLMLTHDEEGGPVIKLIDLGIAKAANRSMDMTATGVFLGKLKYASPEQYGTLSRGERLDGRSDLYGLGIVLYELLTGVRPFVGESPAELLRAHLFMPPIAFSETDREGKVPPELREAIFKALEKKREDRYTSADEFDREIVSLRDRYAHPDDLESTMSILSTMRSTQPAAPDTVTPSAQDRLNRQFGPLTTPSPSTPQLTIVPSTPAEKEKIAINARMAAEKAAAPPAPPEERKPPVEPPRTPPPPAEKAPPAPTAREDESARVTEPAEPEGVDRTAINPITAAERASAAAQEKAAIPRLEKVSLPEAVRAAPEPAKTEAVKETRKPAAPEGGKPEPGKPEQEPAAAPASAAASPAPLPAEPAVLEPEKMKPATPPAARAEQPPAPPRTKPAPEPVKEREGAKPEPVRPEKAPAPQTGKPAPSEGPKPAPLQPDRVLPPAAISKRPPSAEKEPIAIGPSMVAEEAAPPAHAIPKVEAVAPLPAEAVRRLHAPGRRRPVGLWLGAVIAAAIALILWRPWAERPPKIEQVAEGPTAAPTPVSETVEPTAPPAPSPAPTLRPTAPPQPTAVTTSLPTARPVTPAEPRPPREVVERARQIALRARQGAEGVRAPALSPATYRRAAALLSEGERLAAQGADGKAKKSFDSAARLFAQAESAARAEMNQGVRIAALPTAILRPTAAPEVPTPVVAPPTAIPPPTPRPAVVTRVAPEEREIVPSPAPQVPPGGGSASPEQRREIEQTVRAYENAWATRDRGLFKRAFPSNLQAFDQAFRQFENYWVRIDIQTISVTGIRAEVRGRETVAATPKSSVKQEHTGDVTLRLEKQGDRWVIVGRQ
jgi:eukaryotic-like serine/threonine-protein kinase